MCVPAISISARRGPASRISIRSTESPAVENRPPASSTISNPLKASFRTSRPPTVTDLKSHARPPSNSTRRTPVSTTTVPPASSTIRDDAATSDASPFVMNSRVCGRLPGKSGMIWANSHLTDPSSHVAVSRTWRGKFCPASEMNRRSASVRVARANGIATETGSEGRSYIEILSNLMTGIVTHLR